MIAVRALIRPRAIRLGLYPRRFAASRTRVCVSTENGIGAPDFADRIRDTVAFETLDSFAISSNVIGVRAIGVYNTGISVIAAQLLA
jgi:hypothetical protein